MRGWATNGIERLMSILLGMGGIIPNAKINFRNGEKNRMKGGDKPDETRD
ncbi:hypothetical protein Cflav_PD4845 [Pedosphaera parvula Ellin514]|uniref:Uncharacterized protein n=1 Tax=Pedosphaera parvula (strain Ellin514) TaxID=320771 RepID=B9XEU1_PEDPL|nr:hypothetical protein Cflav_PD4845 [Pedosphaera parvula Ellin514]